MDRWLFEWTEGGSLFGWMNWRMDRLMDGWIDEWIDG
jgi:hypothetical protein